MVLVTPMVIMAFALIMERVEVTVPVVRPRPSDPVPVGPRPVPGRQGQPAAVRFRVVDRAPSFGVRGSAKAA
ncbi:MAG TPA: hypothetical protein VFG15_31495 [Amycolatopsis sp.]|nr:hypothetical protein [Amycolatopsis sp.]